jgi:hypothetical protein
LCVGGPPFLVYIFSNNNSYDYIVTFMLPMSITFGSENTVEIDLRPAFPSGAFLERGCAGSARLSGLTKGKRAPEKIEFIRRESLFNSVEAA